jgi:Bacterial membrane protein YfhO
MTEQQTRVPADRDANPASESKTARASLQHALAVLVGFAVLYIFFFAPVIFSDRLLAPGDGIIYFVPNFAAARVFWDTTIWGGFPAVGDAQLMLWYPPALLCSLFGAAGYQPFVLAAYVLASSFTYGYVFTVTQSRVAAAASGCIYGLGAFMLAHIGHAAVIHAAAWLPLVVWSFAMLQRLKVSRLWFVVATLAVACAALAGHPQIFVYTLALAAAFVFVTGWHAPLGRWHYYGLCALVAALGIGLAALQLWPTAELTNLSWRAALGFDEFTAYALPLRQAPVLVFPLLYGGAPGTFYGTAYFGAWPSSADGWGAGELSGYAGLLPLMLASIGFIMHRRATSARFWLGVCTIAFLLTLGAATPLAQFTYHLPIVNKFRAPARHFLELTFAISVLSGLGIKAIEQKATNARLLLRIVLGAGLVLCACLLSLFFFRAKINELAIQRLGHTISLKPWINPAIGVPLLLFLIVSITLLYWHRQPQARSRKVLLLVVLLFDLASFGWFCEWHYRAPYKAYLRAPVAAQSYRAELNATNQRLLPVRGGTGRVSELPPNLSKLWGMPSASGYGPFILTRTSQLLTMPPHGSVDDSWRDPANQNLDVMAVRYLLVPPAEIEPPATTDQRGVSWSAGDFGAQLGPGCDPHLPTDFKLDLPTPLRATKLGVVSALACSVQLTDAQPFATFTLTDVDEHTLSLNLTAGHESSEWAYDCSDVRPTMRHERAPVFRSYPVTRGEVKCEGHDYVALLSVGTLGAIKRIELRWTGPAGTLALKKITVLDEAAHNSTPINPIAGSLHDATRWRRVGNIDAANSGYGAGVKEADVGAATVFENLRARPRAWLVPEVRRVPPDEALNAIRSSRLSDGRSFDPARLALVEDPVDFKAQQPDPAAVARVVRLNSREMEVHTETAAPAFLVTSDVLYPGWHATVDGAPARLYQTDYILRGIEVPAGPHTVRFKFSPKSFYYGALVSGLSLLLLIGCALWLKNNVEG